MMEAFWVFLVQVILPLLLSSLVLILSILFVVHLLRTRASPSNTLAWLLAIFVAPYVAIPLYLAIGGRKMRRMVAGKGRLIDRIQGGEDTPHGPADGIPAVAGGLFPFRGGNRLRLLTTGREAFRTLEERLANARESVYVTTFILGHDSTGRSILETLARKAREGLDVRLLLDSLGSWGLPRRFFDDYRAAGGRLAFFMPMMHLPFRGRANLRNHRKIVLVDRQTAILGGMNLAEDYMGQDDDARRWRDLSLVAEGPLVQDLCTVFHSDWSFAAHDEPGCPPEGLTALRREGSAFEGLRRTGSVEADREAPVQVVPSGPDVEGDPLHDSLITLLVTARERIWIVSPYFIPGEMVQRSLCIAARRGVDVRIVVPRVSNHRLADLVRRGFLQEIQKAGGKVYLFSPVMLHAKLIVIDDSLAVIGSSNMDMRSLFLNYEISLFVYSGEFAAQSAAWVETLLAESREGVKPSSPAGEVLEGIGRLLSPLL